MSIGLFLLKRVAWFVPLVLSLSVHEWAHARAASALGDATAESEGRLTLDPLAHIDPIGTVALPLLGVPFGWAKPVPVNPTRFRRTVSMRMGMLWVALAGPASNMVLASVSLGIYALFVGSGSRWGQGLAEGAGYMVVLNALLAFFNLLPVFPLDGSRMVDGLLPDRLAGPWQAVKRLGMLPLGVVIIVPQVFGWSPFAPVSEGIHAVLGWVAGG